MHQNPTSMDVPPPTPQFSSPSSPFHIHLHSSNNSFPVISVAIIGILATAFLLVAYYVFVIKCCLNWHRIDVLSRFTNSRQTPDELTPNSNSIDGNVAQKGLEEAIIRSIPVIKFRRSGVTEKNRDGDFCSLKCDEQNSTYECAVCLSEFQDGEKLRVIPNCCHAFHIDCIDIWLQTNANCPLCRSSISPSSIFCNAGRILQDIQGPSLDNFDGNDEDYVVIEIKGNNLDESSRDVVSSLEDVNEEECDGKKKGLKMDNVGSVGDEWIEMRDKYKEFGDVQPVRRSFSMDLSINRDLVIEIEQCRRGKHVDEIVSSSGNSLRNCSSSSSCSTNSGKVRRSLFSFGYGKSSKGSIQPLHLDS